ncbi:MULTISPECIES: 3-hydroxybutyryl-CoA dehydrogenase [Streptomyces]|uniref:3-hydroxybutyryl-CoA dehydrogenase n=2 Tax=Streptomyces TaxID=1883 RepID=A0A1V0U4M3_STRVN|nr:MULTISPECIES: 3-hydroxybutyryl-CoA dehydrogenase [Streptomyces]ARF60111.1 3-hydroxybutyryl-CoA dehydrogenase [Streptomyces violaceoruber]KOG82409.1 3-hydroxybutyryl-CoA dehydrogenase [Streptomyces griseus subsp. rhodochrous]MBD3544051.1 3-hydroxybutyryl-CoA dehydrogenase [Streptomyces sp. JV180]MBD3551543.1 3-hydroxybutyryl-CoA dehydrogenase [Streptomyces sp. SP18CM02]QRV26038.1 3-hydroxybutyryl-CoA dehydrogenase [Streptomyces californicus]
MSAAITRVGVVGGGRMGAGIAEVCARAGLDTIVCEADRAAADRARERVAVSLERAVQRGKLDRLSAEDALGRLTFTGSLDDLADRRLVVEAVVEDAAAKTEVFTALDKIVEDPEAILATNTSAIPVMRLGMATQRADRVLGLHFFNPVPVLPLVEVVTSLHTSAETLTAAEEFATTVLGKTVVRSRDRAGFVVNALLIPYLLSAIRMAESGFATAADVDAGMELGCAHPMGPLKLADLIGLDTVASIAASLYDEFKEPLYAPPPLLLRMVEAGLLGRKAGRGFHTYDRG